MSESTLPFLLALLVASLLLAFFVVWPLVRRQHPDDPHADVSVDTDGAARLNREIIRERRARLDEELASLPPDSPERAALVHAFTQAAMADLHPGETADTKAAPPAHNRQRTLLAVVLATLIVALPLAFYRTTGMPEAVVPGFETASRKQDVHALLAELEQRLAEQPTLVEGWLMLGRSRLGMGEHDKAITALETALKLDSDDPALAAQIRTDLADALGQKAQANLRGRPWELIQQALKLQPRHPKAMALAGAYQLSQNRPQAALQYWEPLLQILPPDSAQHQQVKNYIAGVRSQHGLAAADGSAPGASATTGQEAGAGAASGVSAGQASAGNSPAATAGNAGVAGGAAVMGTQAQSTGNVAANGPVLSGSLTLAADLAAAVKADDTVFVAVRAVNAAGEPEGPPLAVKRLTVAGLPLDFRFSDADAMMPAARLSSAKRVVVIARIGRDATPQPGDLEGRSAAVAVDASGVKLSIDRRLP
ncbi:MAG: c-type cytochrome biogenesis protein CcmI [Lautropia sp.]|nr:c-type cytochrome biogenesis protein CcmI [Lautropia sp.]